jgi:hypothetical protein
MSTCGRRELGGEDDLVADLLYAVELVDLLRRGLGRLGAALRFHLAMRGATAGADSMC